MRRKVSGAIVLALVGAVAWAAAPVLDEEVMNTIELVSESLSSNIALQDIAASLTDAKDLDSLFGEVLVYFTERGDAPDAVEYTRKSRELAAAVQTAVATGRFDDAANAASEISRTCKACHRKYKP